MTTKQLTLNRNRHRPGSRRWKKWNADINRANVPALDKMPFNPTLTREERRELRRKWRAKAMKVA